MPYSLSLLLKTHLPTICGRGSVCVHGVSWKNRTTMRVFGYAKKGWWRFIRTKTILPKIILPKTILPKIILRRFIDSELEGHLSTTVWRRKRAPDLWSECPFSFAKRSKPYPRTARSLPSHHALPRHHLPRPARLVANSEAHRWYVFVRPKHRSCRHSDVRYG